MNFFAAASFDRGLDALGGLSAFVVIIFSLVLAVLWIVFPFVVWGKLTELNSEAKRQTALLARIAQQTAPPLSDTTKENPTERYNPLKDEGGVNGWVILVILVVVLVGGILLSKK